jgi:hypothetical protein
VNRGDFMRMTPLEAADYIQRKYTHPYRGRYDESVKLQIELIIWMQRAAALRQANPVNPPEVTG